MQRGAIADVAEHREAAIARDERVEEERRGLIRWLCPDYQMPRFAPDAYNDAAPQTAKPEAAPPAANEKCPWPSLLIDRLAALQSVLADAALDSKEAAAHFDGAPPPTPASSSSCWPAPARHGSTPKTATDGRSS